MVSVVDTHYPIPCAFCKISAAYPAEPASPIPTSPDAELVSPQCHLILSTPHVLAFLDIMPMAPGHLLLTSRKHYTKLSDLQGPSSGSAHAAEEAHETARALGEYLPILSRALCRVTGVDDWNVVQNNGARAAQVVPHIHFHLIPRYQEGRGRWGKDAKGKSGSLNDAMARSWTMFERGSREDLDDEEGREVAGKLRVAVKKELEEREGGARGSKGKL